MLQVLDPSAIRRWSRLVGGGGRGSGPAPAAVFDKSGAWCCSGSELVTVLEGANAPPGLARAVQDHPGATRPDVEVVPYEGGQGGYPLLIGVE
ncbi:hypothetical protein [Streptosporangium subroseum]|uniref:hypothetical protein n=1 Tax=Streptosporangium subroseum TaxID=106412 RepID=UPI0030856DDF|nr:hypothetical protein OHB15_06760 [Streptosporangium subroseum]